MKIDDSSKLYLIILSCIAILFLIFCFWGFQEVAKNNNAFLELTFSSFIFQGAIVFLLLYSKIEKAPRKAKSKLYLFALIFLITVTLISLIVTMSGMISLATVPRGGIKNHQLIYFDPMTVNLERDPYNSGEYFGTSWRTLYEANYPVGGINIIPGGTASNVLTFYCNKNVSLNMKIMVYLFLYPRMKVGEDNYWFYVYARSETFQYSENGTHVEMVPGNTGSFLDFILWGGLYGPEGRIRLDGGYKVSLKVRLSAWGEDYGETLKFTVSTCPWWSGGLIFSIIDVQVDSSFQNGLAQIMCGIFAGTYVYTLGTYILGKEGIRIALYELRRK